MIRFIILAVVGYIAYRALKSWMFPESTSSKPVAGQKTRAIDDVMIKDPYCEAYFPKREAVHLRLEDEVLMFCSTRCKDKFLAARSEEKDL